MPTEGKNGGAPPPPDRAAREREAAAALDAIRAPRSPTRARTSAARKSTPASPPRWRGAPDYRLPFCSAARRSASASAPPAAGAGRSGVRMKRS